MSPTPGPSRHTRAPRPQWLVELDASKQELIEARTHTLERAANHNTVEWGPAKGRRVPSTPSTAQVLPTPCLDPARWNMDGFAVIQGIVNDSGLREARVATQLLIDAAFDASGMPDLDQWLARVAQVPDPADWDPRLAKLEHNRRLCEAAAAALGLPPTERSPAVRCAWAHLVLKPPGHARPIPWHIDRPTWPLPPGVEGVAAWISLDPLGADSGRIRYAPGSHLPDAPLQHYVIPQANAGDAIVHHADVLHASAGNISGAWRRAWIGVFIAA